MWWMSFLRHGRSFHPMGPAWSGRSAGSMLRIGLDEPQPAIPWRVGLHQSSPPLHRPVSVCLIAIPPEQLGGGGWTVAAFV